MHSQVKPSTTAKDVMAEMKKRELARAQSVQTIKKGGSTVNVRPPRLAVA